MSKFRIATFNANSIRARQPIILDWLSANEPDVLCVQETKVQDKDFPIEPYTEIGYHCSFVGQKSYNGVATLTKLVPEEARGGMGDGVEDPEQARLIYTNVGGVHVVNTYVPQGFEPGSEKFEYKLEWFKRLGSYFEKHFKPGDPLIWTGDINVAPAPEDVYDPDKLDGHCGYHPDERAAFEKLLGWGFTDIFRKYVSEPKQFTFYDFRLPKAIDRGLGWRIDHILATAPLAEKSVNSYIDLEPRRLTKPSDHTFLVADFEI